MVRLLNHPHTNLIVAFDMRRQVEMVVDSIDYSLQQLATFGSKIKHGVV